MHDEIDLDSVGDLSQETKDLALAPTMSKKRSVPYYVKSFFKFNFAAIFSHSRGQAGPPLRGS